ncbi:hypothetical protein EK21DRAFT_85194 [Setomelanomma holmii]|uniref:Uncharacterized protein n=1 Tax=Setomelanomma holmii TaxID=210430 RepID=A0A9P4LP49_9PLEO|nr:hypothetical protein EK21DRAFT_85194 [Setomelanomma holmii]
MSLFSPLSIPLASVSNAGAMATSSLRFSSQRSYVASYAKRRRKALATLDLYRWAPRLYGRLAYILRYFKFDKFKGDVQKCWVAADCLFEAAGESRKQQSLKDIAWPERRLIYVTNKLNWIVEILVLALGLVPTYTSNRKETVRKNQEGNMLATAVWSMRRASIIMCLVVCAIGVVASYAGLVFMEIYSKRSAIGCPVRIWVATWYVVALVPAAIHSGFASLRRMWYSRREIKRQASQRSQHANDVEHTDHLLNDAEYADLPPSERPQKHQMTLDVKEKEAEAERKEKVSSAVQGVDEDWPVQMAWAVYYIAGSLIFTSIMAVTVVELVVWVGLGFAGTGSSKILAFFFCLVFEQTDAR